MDADDIPAQTRWGFVNSILETGQWTVAWNRGIPALLSSLVSFNLTTAG